MNGAVHWADIPREWLAAGTAVGFVCALALLRQTLARWAARRGLQRRMQRARRAERDAPSWLAKHGYAVVAAQVSSQYELSLDGQPIAIGVRADYVVERAGLRYVAEVKSGGAAPRIQTQATRRQLLEYRLAFAVDGVLLVDAEAEHVHVVRFPASDGSASSPRAAWLWVGVLGVLAVLVALALLRAR
jgi:hypothetical protein